MLILPFFYCIMLSSVFRAYRTILVIFIDVFFVYNKIMFIFAFVKLTELINVKCCINQVRCA